MTGHPEPGLEIVCAALFAAVPEAWLPGRGALGGLERLLSRGDCGTERPGGLERNLCRKFGIEMADDEEVPAGALSLLADGTDPGTAYWLRADPVRLHADRDRLILFRPDIATLQELAAGGYIDAFNRHFRGEGWHLVAPRPTRWYLAAPRPLALGTHPLRAVDGRSIDPFLPSGADAPVLRRVVTEAEMLLHDFLAAGGIDTGPDRGANSLWLSGGGVLPRRGHCHLEVVAGTDPLVRGLALSGGLDVASLPAPAAHRGGALWVANGLEDARLSGDGAEYAVALRQLAGECAAAADRIRRGDLKDLCVGDGVSRRCCAGARELRRWWRGGREFVHFLR